MMRAATYTATGPADKVLKIEDLPVPTPAKGEVLVRVMASGINPADVKRRAGWNGAGMEHEKVIPHCDGAGEITAVGDGVDPARVGERVWLWNAQGGYGEAGRAFGTAAAFIALPAAQALPLPDTISFEEGACLGVPAFTAWLALLSDGPIAGDWVLIQGAAGAVGQCCVQMALAVGAKVIATVSHDEGAAAVRKLGPAEIVNRHEADLQATVARLTGSGVRRIVEVDLAANMATDAACLAPHGTIASYSCSSDPTPRLPYYDFANLGATIRFVQGFRLTPAERRTATQVITSLLETDQLRPVLGATYPLEDIAAAHDRVAEGALGQTVLTLSPPNGR